MSPAKRHRMDLAALCHRRWSLPILAALSGRPGLRFAQFQQTLGVSRQPLRDNLDTLLALDLIRRNPGHGHPLRPEYLLTARGRALAPPCVDLTAFLSSRGLDDLAARKWSLPVLAAIGGGAAHFGEIREGLPNLVPRALALALRELENRNLILRAIGDGHPPEVRYSLNPTGRAVAARLAALRFPATP